MNGIQFSGKLVGLLGAATEGLCDWLSDALPALDSAWWSTLVLSQLSQLSYPQRERVDRQGIDSLRKLDLLNNRIFTTLFGDY